MNDGKGEEKFSFSYSAPTETERREIESIKNQYADPNEIGGLDKLRELDKRVTRPPAVIGWVMGIAGTLVLGIGMTMSLEWNMLAWGAVVGLLGIALAAVAYPVYKAVLNRNKRKYAKRIIELSDALLNNARDDER